MQHAYFYPDGFMAKYFFCENGQFLLSGSQLLRKEVVITLVLALLSSLHSNKNEEQYEKHVQSIQLL